MKRMCWLLLPSVESRTRYSQGHTTILITPRGSAGTFSELYRCATSWPFRSRAYDTCWCAGNDSCGSGAAQRLSAMQCVSEPVPGFRIAALDLELRWRGQLLGRQHRHIEAYVWYIYTPMLERRGLETEGRRSGARIRTTLSLGWMYAFRRNYIPSENFLLRTLQRFLPSRPTTKTGCGKRALQIDSGRFRLRGNLWSTPPQIHRRANLRFPWWSGKEPGGSKFPSGNASGPCDAGTGGALEGRKQAGPFRSPVMEDEKACVPSRRIAGETSFARVCKGGINCVMRNG